MTWVRWSLNRYTPGPSGTARSRRLTASSWEIATRSRLDWHLRGHTAERATAAAGAGSNPDRWSADRPVDAGSDRYGCHTHHADQHACRGEPRNGHRLVSRSHHPV